MKSLVFGNFFIPIYRIPQSSGCAFCLISNYKQAHACSLCCGEIGTLVLFIYVSTYLHIHTYIIYNKSCLGFCLLSNS